MQGCKEQQRSRVREGQGTSTIGEHLKDSRSMITNSMNDCVDLQELPVKKREQEVVNDSKEQRESEGAVDDLFVAPMSLLPVCPSWCSPVANIAETAPVHVPLVSTYKTSTDHCNGNLSSSSPSLKKSPSLRRDPLAIRHQYLTQLGISVSSRDFERSTGKRRKPKEGIKVKLKSADTSNEFRSPSIFKAFATWYTGSSSSDEEGDNVTSDVSKEQPSNSVTEEPKRHVGFKEEVEVFFIPLHNEYSQRQRDGMWHTRDDFVFMVERNLEEMYDEVEAEYELQLQQEVAEGEEMRREEIRQRLVETELRKKGSRRLEIISAEVAQEAKKFTSLVRSPLQIRLKYLQQLGIDR